LYTGAAAIIGVVVMGAELALRRGGRRGIPAKAAKARSGEKVEAV